MPKIIKIG